MRSITRSICNSKIEVISHDAMHLDEITALWLVEEFANEEFLEKFCPDDILEIGIGDGPFNEHPTINSQRKSEECATTLVAKALGVFDHPALEKIIKFVTNHDLNGSEQPLDLASIVKVLTRQNIDHPEVVIDWVEDALDAIYDEQLWFWTKTKTEFNRLAQVEEIMGPNGRPLIMATVVSNDTQISRFARSIFGCQAAMVIQQQSNGNTQIYTNHKFGLTLHDTAQIIRLEEQRAKGQLVTTDWKTLAQEGRVEGAEEWWFFTKGQMLLNGSLTARNIPPTHLTLEQIQDAVRIGINSTAFSESHGEDCKHGVCTSTIQNPCHWYHWGLHRCRKMRFLMKQQ